MEIIKNSLGQSHDMVRNVVNPGDIVVDATAGNGNDTLFLADLVGDKGHVFSFDIQDLALEKTKAKLEKAKVFERATLIKDGHQNMGQYIDHKVKAVMFNLGYLPGGDHNIGTRGETTVEAVKKAMDLIEINGVVSIVIYYGGDSGFDEKDYVMKFLETIDYKKFVVMKTEFINQINCPPIFICIEKLA